VAVDALAAAVASDEKAATFLTSLHGRAVAVPGASARANQGANNRDTGFALQVFGRSIRESNCDCDRSMEASLLQTVYLQNDNAVLNALEGGKDSWIEQITKAPASKLTDGSDVKKLDLKKEIARMEVRLKRAQKDGNEQQIAQVKNRLRELNQADKTKKEIVANPGTLAIDSAEMIRQAYLRTVNRLPTADEIDRCEKFLAASESPAAGAKGILWTLINTKEFIVNH
jgi:hypothetical protein